MSAVIEESCKRLPVEPSDVWTCDGLFIDTFVIGYLHSKNTLRNFTPFELDELLGFTSRVDCNIYTFSEFEWCFRFRDALFTVYDYKQDRWVIGSNSFSNIVLAEELFARINAIVHRV